LSTQIVSDSEMKRQAFYGKQVAECNLAILEKTGVARRYHVITFGCQQNENDSERMAGLLDEMGYQLAEEPREADLILLNTCSVRENADDRLFGHLGMVKTLRRDKPDLIVGLCGCMMMQDDHVQKVRRSYPFVDILFGPQDIYRLPEFLFHRLTDARRVYEVGEEDTLAEGLPVHRARKFRALVSIMYGCNNFCTYCIVPYTRGRERSRKLENILQEIRQLAADGYKEILLLGQNVNSYGQDLALQDPDQANFAQLLAACAEIPGICRIRFMTSHPKDISDELLAVIGHYEVIEPHLHLPLQSGSNAILKAMNRHYTREQYLAIVNKARALRPGLTISTDLIVGFPGETEADFADTLSLMEAVRFDAAFTFHYSKRTGTPAATMAEQVPDDVVKERFARLLALQNSHSLASNQALEGTGQTILIEGRSEGDPNVLTGRTADNRLINCRITDLAGLPPEAVDADGQLDGDALEGRLARVRITRAKTFSLEAEWEHLLP
jgi:tRNA-2-methylthio-N6-dimethylallyladenosine synthase